MFEAARELLFGDVALPDWTPRNGDDAGAEPWLSFAAARAALASGDPATATTLLRQVADAPDLEPRHTLQAWHVLRQLGINPEAGIAKRVLGVVLEVQLDGGLDTLAAYADHTARYFNHGGNVIVWDAPEAAIGRLIDELLRAGQQVADRIGPWEGPRRPAPPTGSIRLNLLTPSGLHFGEGPFSVLSADPMGGPLIHAGTNLMQALIARVETRNDPEPPT